MNCPRCNEKMSPTNCSGISANTCMYCNGMWLSNDSLERLLHLDSEAPSKDELIKSFKSQHDKSIDRKCPNCSGKTLNKIHIHGVELDLCSICSGLFFDEGELKMVFPNSSKATNEFGPGKYVASEGLFWVLMGLFSSGC